MLLHLTRTASAAHSDVLDRAAESCLLMTLEMIKRDKYIGIHDRTAYVCLFAIFAIWNGNYYIIRTSKTISNDDLTSRCDCIKTIDVSTVKMFKGMLSATWIQSITICKERQSTLLLNYISHSLCIVWS